MRTLKMECVSSEEFQAFRARLPVATKEGLFDAYRISQHTWYKMRDGKPVKQNVVARLRERYSIISAQG